MQFYDEGRQAPATSRDGIRMALQSILVSPRFVFRLEGGAGDASGRRRRTASPTTTWRRGCRSSSGAPGPDAELIDGRGAGQLQHAAPASRSRCGACSPTSAPRRCPRASPASGCGCRTSTSCIRSSPSTRSSTRRSRDAMRRETELFFDSIVREDRNVLDLLNADYTLRQRAAGAPLRHPGVNGDGLPRVTLPAYRRGLLGQGSILTLTSVADRTSPVLRGKWVMEVLLGTPPPPPPPNVPALDESVTAIAGRQAPLDAPADGRAPQEPGLHLVPPGDRSARPGARQLRRHRRVAHQGQRGAGRRRSATSTTARKMDGPVGPAGRRC